MLLTLFVFAAGGLGALCRGGLDAVVSRRWKARVKGPFSAFPASTCLINVSGAFLLGLLTGYATAHTSQSVRDLATVAGVGFLGAYTTFSTEQWHTLGLLRDDHLVEAANVLGSLVASLALAALGLWAGARL
jgi:CrcB protein